MERLLTMRSGILRQALERRLPSNRQNGGGCIVLEREGVRMLRFVVECCTLFISKGRSIALFASDVLVAILQQTATHAASAVLAVIAFYLSLVSTSLPPTQHDRQQIDKAIQLLADHGFSDEVFLLKGTTTFRATDHWLNALTEKENAYASTNFPFQIITLYPDFYTKATDDTERAMVLMHEARHLMGENEHEAYAYVWRHRKQIGWSMKTHGSTESYVTIEQQTREMAPELFNCPDKPWEDCTE
jgi:hypothetical protein